MQNNSLLLVAMGEFYEKLANCCANNQTSSEGNKTECTTLQLGLSKIINEPKHIKTVSSSTDLLFTSWPNLVTESGVHSSLHRNCHHQIIYASFNLQSYYSPLYCRGIWHY